MKNITFVFIIFLLLQIFSCNDEPIEPLLYGSLEGLVIDDEDQTVISGAYIYTAPSSNSLVTDEDGKFVMSSILEGEYEVVVEKTGYSNGRKSVIITEDGNTQTTILLKKKITSNSSPETPADESPLHLSVDNELSIELSWSASDSDQSDSLTFDVLLYSDNSSQFETVGEDINAKSFQLDDLKYGTLYFWQIIVKDGINDPVIGPIWQFETKPFPEYRILFSRKIDNVFQIFSGDTNGNELQLTYSSTPVWRPRYNPQRTKIAFISVDGIEKHIYTMNSDGTNIQKVTENIPIESFDEKYMSYCWSPNGSELIYMNYNQLYKIAPDGSGLELLIQISSDLSYAYVDWTNDPSARLIIRTSASNQYDGGLYLIHLDGSGEEQVFPNLPGRIGGGSFSLDGNKILFSYDVSGFENQDGKQIDASIQVLDLNNNNSYSDFSLDKPAGTNDLDPRYSPDGANIIFTNTNNDGVSVKNIFLLDSDGDRFLLFENAEMPDWR
ncbi:MAG: carboxypeptidase-like regulatory domain-containing protein [Saprospiraceae bacterium]